MSMRRANRKDARPGWVRVVYGRLPGWPEDIIYIHGGEGATKRHSRVLNTILNARPFETLGDRRSGLDMLRESFDIETIDIRIKAKAPEAE